MKIIIAGSRNFNDYERLVALVDQYLQGVDEPISIISGGAKGPDELGERYAEERGYAVQHFLPDWKKYGRGAGPIRNREMAQNGDLLIAFWDGKSKGTKSMIELAKLHGLKIHVVEIGER